MIKLGDKDLKGFQKQASQKDPADKIFFRCKECCRSFIDGTRFRCLSCADTDVCFTCYKGQAHFRNEHEMILIENRAFWEELNFRELLSAYVDPYFSWSQLDRTKEKITSKDIYCCSEKFKAYMDGEMKYYNKKFRKHAEQWFHQFF